MKSFFQRIITSLLIFFPHLCFSQFIEGRYNIRLANGRVLEAEALSFKNNGCKIQTWQLNYNLNQLWDIKRVPGTTNRYYIFNVGANKVLDADASTVNKNGCKVQLWDHIPANNNQQWILQSTAAGKFTLRNAASSGDKVLNIAGAVLTRAGIAVELADNSNSEAQKWSFVKSYDSAVVAANFVDLRLNQSALKTQAPNGNDRGFCTYFGNTAALEAAYKKRGFGEQDLSEEYFSIVAKTNWLHARWDEITSSNYPENQIGGLQGGGQIQLLMKGLKIPLERDVPYKSTFILPALPNPLT
ncbi:MAG: RICIN domain-containing protein, partial [Ferruginibacter sp.]